MAEPLNPLNAANPYLSGMFAPVLEEGVDRELEILGEVPKDLTGTYFRNGPNPRFDPKGRHHWFDGDAMIHALSFADGRAEYRNRWVMTEGLKHEIEAGRSLFTGLIEPDFTNPLGYIKDNANTDVIVHNGRLYALFYRCGKPYALDPHTLETLGPDDFGAGRPHNLSAHAKVDAVTGEMMVFDLQLFPSVMHYGVVNARGELVNWVDIDLPGPRFSHDMAITEHYSILMDLPVFFDPEAMAAGKHRMKFFADIPARFAIIPRHGQKEDVRWFEGEACYIYHPLNAWEDGDEIVMDVCRVPDPVREHQGESGLQRMLRVLSGSMSTAHLHRYRFNLKTGQTREEKLDDQRSEFPSINLRHMGRFSRYAWNVTLPDSDTLCFDGLVKYDTLTGRKQEMRWGEGRFGSESPFAPRDHARSEDDGYVVSFVHDNNTGRSECVVLEAQDITAPPVCRILLPRRVPAGFHATWMEGR